MATDMGSSTSGQVPINPVPLDAITLQQRLEWDAAIKQIDQIDVALSKPKDTLEPAGLTLVQFAPKTTYDASAQSPELPLPDPDGQTGPQPYGMAEQRLIKQNLSKQLLDKLKATSLSPEQQQELYNAILNGEKISDPALAQTAKAITDDVEKSIRQEAHLPASWTILSTSPSDWVPVAMGPNDSVGIMTPAAVNQARAGLILSNAEDQMTAIQKAMQNVLKTLPPNDPAQITGRNYIAVIAEAISALKAALRDIQLNDAQKSKDIENARANLTDLREKALQEDVDKQKEMQHKQAKAHRWSFAMKIIGPTIAALATIVGAALAIFTFGASTALIVAGIAVGVAMTAYSIVDSATGCTSKLMKVVNDFLASKFPNEEVQKLIKIIAVTLIVAILAIVTAGAGAGSVAAQAAGQVTKQIAMEVIKQLSIQMIIMTIMSSNAIPEMLGAILKANGVDDKTNQVWQMIVMGITLVVSMIAIAKAAPTGEATTASTSVLASIRAIGEEIVSGTLNLLNKLKEGVQTAVEEMVKLLNALLKQLTNLAKGVPEALQTVYQNLVSAASALVKAVTEGQTVEIIKDMLNQFKNALSEFSAATTLKKMMEEATEILVKAGVKTKEYLAQLAEGFFAIGRDLRNIRDTIGVFRIYKELQATLENAENLPRDQLIEKLRTILKTVIKEEEFKALKPEETIAKATDTLDNLKQRTTQLQISGMRGISKSLQITSGVIDFADAMAQGIMGLQLYHMLKQLGDVRKAEELLQAIIDQLNKLLLSLGSDEDANAEALKGANKFLTDFIKGQEELATKIMSTQHV